jgi:hypothetical protein
MATHSNGISALQLQRQLAFGSYKTAWLICAKLRCSMLAPGRSPWPASSRLMKPKSRAAAETILSRAVVGAAIGAKCSSSAPSRSKTAGLAPARIRLGQVADYSAASLHPFLAANLAPGATAKTDGWPGYPGAAGITHDPHVVGKMAAHILLPWVHRIFSNLKVWALGVYHGLRRKHLQSYLDEFVFRFNRRRTHRIPVPPRHRRRAPASPLQHVDLTGSKGIRLISFSFASGSASRKVCIGVLPTNNDPRAIR